jgi:hypothetical protein
MHHFEEEKHERKKSTLGRAENQVIAGNYKSKQRNFLINSQAAFVFFLCFILKIPTRLVKNVKDVNSKISEVKKKASSLLIITLYPLVFMLMQVENFLQHQIIAKLPLKCLISLSFQLIFQALLL